MTPLFEVVTSHSRPHCLQLLRQLRRATELALVDLGLPPVPHRPDEGFALISDLLKVAPEIRIVVLSGQSDDGNARHARTLGAPDFVAKPCDPGDLQQILNRTLAFRALDERHREGASPLLGNSPAMQKLRVQLRQYADLPFPVLIEGESGSGQGDHCLRLPALRNQTPTTAISGAQLCSDIAQSG